MPPRANRPDDFTVTQSLIDRLTDKEPNLASDPATTRAQSVRQLKAALRRDLEWLLNTRRNPEAAPESMEELAKSLYNYGLPDFSHANVNSSRDRKWLAREVENTVALFEPRLTDIRVQIVEDPDAGPARILRFQIEGMLQMDPAPEQVSFDTVLQLTSGEYQVRGERSA
jgi:type VI secretion system protein ImpF